MSSRPNSGIGDVLSLAPPNAPSSSGSDVPVDVGPMESTMSPPAATNTGDGNGSLTPPAPAFAVNRPPFAPLDDSPRDSYRNSYTPSTANSAVALTQAGADNTADASTRPALTPRPGADGQSDKDLPTALNEDVKHPPRQYRPLLWLACALGALVLIVLAVMLPVYFTVIRKDKQGSTTAGATAANPSPTSPAGNGPGGSSGALSGGDGSTVTTSDGRTFIYTNKFGGHWVSDPSNPFNNDARPNSWTPPLNTSWNYATDQMMGVNLGGWFVLEPFITPALYEKYLDLPYDVIDEWTLHMAMAQDTAGGGLSQLENHYDTFITEEDIAEIAGAGLNWIRVPLPFWAVATFEDEPFLAKTCWKYFVRLIGWARKYGLRINLDLHSIPGSQNGYNHSGRFNQINFLLGVMGIANAERTLDYMRIITEFISQPEYRDVVAMFGLMNEPSIERIGREQLTRFYMRAHDMIREIGGRGAGNGPFLAIHDTGIGSWENFLPGSDRIALDVHPYFAFNSQPNTEPLGTWPERTCRTWRGLNRTRVEFGVSFAGEWSNAINDCGYYLKGVGNTATTYGGDCNDWSDASRWTQETKDGIKEVALANMDISENWFFWTWKISNSSITGIMGAPLWSYQAGLRGGWMPTDPREARGKCAALGAPDIPFDGTYSAWQTGGAGAGTISPAISASFSQWPPPVISDLANAALAPTYTATGAVPTLTAADGLDGWYDAQDTAGGMTTVAGCPYPDAWDSAAQTTPTALCTGAPAARRTALPEPVITPPPRA